MKSPWSWVALISGILLTLFALQNMAAVTVSFLGFEFQTRRIILIAISVGVGFVLGKTVKFNRGPKKP